VHHPLRRPPPFLPLYRSGSEHGSRADAAFVCLGTCDFLGRPRVFVLIPPFRLASPYTANPCCLTYPQQSVDSTNGVLLSLRLRVFASTQN